MLLKKRKLQTSQYLILFVLFNTTSATFGKNTLICEETSIRLVMSGGEVGAAGGGDGRWLLPCHVLLFDMRVTCQSMASSLLLLWGLVILISECVRLPWGLYHHAEDSHH